MFKEFVTEIENQFKRKSKDFAAIEEHNIIPTPSMIFIKSTELSMKQLRLTPLK